MSRDKSTSENENESPFASLSEMAKRAVTAGIGAIFMTEESIRNALNDMKMPKEAMGFLIDQAKKQKNDLVAAIAHEIANFLSKVKIHEEIQKALNSVEVHVDAKLSFSPKGRARVDHFDLKMGKVEDDLLDEEW